MTKNRQTKKLFQSIRKRSAPKRRKKFNLRKKGCVITKLWLPLPRPSLSQNENFHSDDERTVLGDRWGWKVGHRCFSRKPLSFFFNLPFPQRRRRVEHKKKKFKLAFSVYKMIFAFWNERAYGKIYWQEVPGWCSSIASTRRHTTHHAQVYISLNI